MIGRLESIVKRLSCSRLVFRILRRFAIALLEVGTAYFRNPIFFVRYVTNVFVIFFGLTNVFVITLALIIEITTESSFFLFLNRIRS